MRRCQCPVYDAMQPLKAVSDQYELDINLYNLEIWLIFISCSLYKVTSTAGKHKGIIRINPFNPRKTKIYFI